MGECGSAAVRFKHVSFRPCNNSDGNLFRPCAVHFPGLGDRTGLFDEFWKQLPEEDRNLYDAFLKNETSSSPARK